MLKDVFKNILNNGNGHYMTIIPVGREVTVTKKGDTITMSRSWFDGEKSIPTDNVSFGKLTEGVTKGYLTILTNEFVRINQRSCEQSLTVYSSPKNVINSFLSGRLANLTFLPQYTTHPKNIYEIIQHIHDAIEAGVYIDQIMIDGLEYDVSKSSVRSVLVSNHNLTITPQGAILRTVVGSEYPEKYSNTFTYTDNIKVANNQTRAITIDGEVVLLADYTFADAIEECPCCASPVSYKDEVAFCVNIECSPMMEAFINSVSKQTGIPTSVLIDQHNLGRKFSYKPINDDNHELLVETYDKRDSKIDILRIFMDVFGEFSLMSVLDFLYPRKELVVDTIMQSLLDMTKEKLRGIEWINDYKRSSDVDCIPVLLTGDFGNIGDYSISLMLANAGLFTTIHPHEALFAIHGGGSTEFLEFIQETTNMYILDVSSDVELLSRILKNK